MMSDLVPIRSALLSVSDKSGLVEFAAALANEFHVELISTGGTAAALRAAGLAVKDVGEITGVPEMMDGRVKTLHPKIHGGLLALRDNAQHLASMQAQGIAPIDLLCVNLYPFENTIARPGSTFDDAIENIDVGGPAMIRAAAKNHRWVLVVTAADRYEKVLGDLREHHGHCCGKHRLKQAQRAFAHTAAYDAAIASYLARELDQTVAASGVAKDAHAETVHRDKDESLPATISLALKRKQILRYGENPHQRAALYIQSDPERSEGSEEANQQFSIARAAQLHGKSLSYINLLDADAALGCVMEFDGPAACIVKHATPCGAATSATIADAFDAAYAGDPVAAFGGIVAVNRAIDLAAAERIVAGQKFLEVVVAPSFDAAALDLLKTRWKNVRLLADGAVARPSRPDFSDAIGAQPGRDGRATSLRFASISGGFLVQTRDHVGLDESNWKIVSRRNPTDAELSDLRLAWLVGKHVKSNAIVIAGNGATLGIGGGQVDRVGAARVAIEKSAGRSSGAAAASDAFFPFADGPKLLLAAGVRAIIQPGGSVRDQETIDAVNAAHAAMIFTGTRHFRH